jgi:hypothetical protein
MNTTHDALPRGEAHAPAPDRVAIVAPESALTPLDPA